MSLVAFDGTPLTLMGAAGLDNRAIIGAGGDVLQDATLESCQYIGRIITADGGSHTIDTTGSSSIQWRTGTSTFANAGTVFSVGLAAVDATLGPPGRAVHVLDAITFDVSAVFAGGAGGVTSGAWQTSVPTTGTKTVANGDIVVFATQMVTRAGADLVRTRSMSSSASDRGFPFQTSFLGGTYAVVSRPPNAIIVFSDGVLGWFFGGSVFSTVTTQTWNSGSATKEYGNFIQLPFPTKVYGISSNIALTADCDIILYSDPLGTPVAEKTISQDLNVTSAATANLYNAYLFTSPYTTTAAQPLAAILKPGASNVSSDYISLNASTHQALYSGGTNAYAVNRASGAFAAQNSNKDRFGIGLLVGAFDDGTAAGAGMLVHPGMQGGCRA